MARSNVPRLKLYIQEDGNTAEELEAMGRRAYEAKPILKVIQGLMIEGGIAQFESEGSRGGLPWEKDKASYANRKAREKFGDETEIRKGDLRAAMLSSTSGGNAIRRLSKTSTTVGVRLFYAAFQGHKRQLLSLTNKDKDLYAEKMIAYILEGKL